MLLLRLSGWLLLRFVERALLSLLFHAPPRSTHLPVSPQKRPGDRSELP
jgi:hypothetical protein